MINLCRKLCFLVVTVLILLRCSVFVQEKKEEYVLPNIVWIVLEDQSPNFFPMYGDHTVKLPAIETLAEQSIIYENAYSPAPVCAPARSSIITGMYPTTLGTHNMRCYNAYDTANQPALGIPSYSPVVPRAVQPFTHFLRSKGYYCSNNAKEDYNFATLPSMWDESGKNATWRNRKEGQAFFSVFNIEETHESRIWQNGQKELSVSPEKVNVLPYFPDDSVVRHDLAVNYSNLARADLLVEKIVNQLKEDGLYDETIIFFYADHGGPFPRHKRALYETGTKVPLMVKMPGQTRSEKNDRFISFIDLAPSMLSLAGIEPPAYLQGTSFLGRFRSENDPEYLFTASDRFDECYDRSRAVRNGRYKYIRNYNTDLPYALPIAYRMNMPMMNELIHLSEAGQLDSAAQRWMSPSKPKEELYDLENDPFELNNLADVPDMNITKRRLKKALTDWEEATNDLGSYDEKELMKRWLINGRQVQLESPKLEMVNGQYLIIYHRQEGVTNIYRENETAPWQIFLNPIPITEKMRLEIKAVKIGFNDSRVVTFEN